MNFELPYWIDDVRVFYALIAAFVAGMAAAYAIDWLVGKGAR